jgi:hypothetical protein
MVKFFRQGNVLLPKDYSFRAKHRTKFQKKSGGISIVFKNYLEPFLHFPDTESDFVQWLKLSKKILNLYIIFSTKI